MDTRRKGALLKDVEEKKENRQGKMTRKKLDVGHISKETKRFRNISFQEKSKKRGCARIALTWE